MMVAGNIPGRTRTLSMALYSAQQQGRDVEATTFLLIAIAVGVVAVFASERLADPKLSRRGAGR